MKNVEKLAIALIILYSLTAVFAGLTPVWMRQMDHHSAPYLPMILMFIHVLISMGKGIACGTWLFIEAKREGHFYWLWCFAGLIIGINAVILFFVWLGFLELKALRVKEVLPNDTDGHTA